MHFAFLLVLPVAMSSPSSPASAAAGSTEEIKLWRTLKGTVDAAPGDIIEADDAYTGTHSRGVVELVLAVSDVLDLSPAERTQAEFTALLHDVGKIRIPKTIIQKPGPLDGRRAPPDRDAHRRGRAASSTAVGGSLAEIGHIVRSCHERYDGNGYPDRLAGEDIPLVARIVCCCDALNAMTTDRPYRRRSPQPRPRSPSCAPARAPSSTRASSRRSSRCSATDGDAEPAAAAAA